MDLLTRSLKYQLEKGDLKGVRVAAAAPPLTCSLYADDLLVMGAATILEVQRVVNTIKNFSVVSGQKVGPEKSSIWFSKPTPDIMRTQISYLLQVQSLDPSDRYLGAPIKDGREAHDFLITKFTERLQMWKGRMLSQAGRVVLIKATLQSIPVYHLSTTKLPVRVLNSLVNLMRRFFWGKQNQDRYLTYVAWDKICRPIEEGGLGIKDLVRFNEALLLKYLWKLASGCDTQWSAVICAKYIPRSLLWQSQRTYNCTIFWRSLMNLRDKLKSTLQWKLAGGNQCHAFGEPCFEGAMDISPPNGQCMNLLVSDLRDESTGLWNTQLLIQLYGYANCLVILNSVHLSNEGQRDVLICNMSANGGFRVRDAYNTLRGVGNGSVVGSAKLWNWVWKRGNIAPRIRIFIWKLIKKALPLGVTLASRGIQVDTICAICAESEEDTNHMVFLCPFARACWYSSNLGITSHSLTEPLVDTLTEMIEVIDENQWTEIVNSIWALWRCRNDATYGGNKPDIQRFQDYYARIQQESQLIGTTRQPRKRQEDNLITGGRDDNQLGRVKCWVDGSWIRNWKGGIGAVICKGEELLLYTSTLVKACSPLQTEAIALMTAVKEVQSLGILVCDFITDCEELQQLVSSPQPPLESTWSAFVECFTIWKLLRAIPGYRCYHIERSQNSLADQLAVKGRVEEWKLRGYTYPIFKPH